MALQGGHRFAVSMGDAFPHGLYAMGVKQAEDFNSETRRSKPARDNQHGDQFVWTVTCIDRDPDAREKEVKVKVTAPVCPDLPEEVLPGSGLRCIEFSGLTVTPYVQEARGGGRARMALSFRASGVHEAGKGPESLAEVAAVTSRARSGADKAEKAG
jgi:hypothetical protein